MTVRTDQIRTVRDAKTSEIIRVEDGGETKILGACGRLGDFRAAYAFVNRVDGGIVIDKAGAEVLNVKAGDSITHVDRW